MHFLWICVSVLSFINVSTANQTTAINQNQPTNFGSSFVVSAGYGVQENKNATNFNHNRPQPEVQALRQARVVKKDRANDPDDVIYGSSSNNVPRAAAYQPEDAGRPTLGELQNLIRKLEDSKSTKIVRVLKVPAVYEIHMHPNNIENEEYVHIKPEHFGNLKLNQGYMKNLQRSVKQHPVKNSNNNIRHFRNVQTNKNNNEGKFNIPKGLTYDAGILTAHVPNLKPIIENKEVYEAENSEIKFSKLQLNHNQPQAIYEVPAPVLGKFPYPKPFTLQKTKQNLEKSKPTFFEKNQKRQIQQKNPHRNDLKNHQTAASNPSPVYYLPNNYFHGFPDLSLYYRTKKAVDHVEKNNMGFWDSKIRSGSVDSASHVKFPAEERKVKTQKLYPLRRSDARNQSHPLRFILYIKEKTFDGD